MSDVRDDTPIPLDGPPSRAEVVDSCRRLALDSWVKQFVLLVQLAAEMYPEEIRAALSYVFDAQAAEERLKQIAGIANHAELKLADLVETTGWLERETRPMVEDAIRQSDRLAALEARVDKALAFLREEVRRLRRNGKPAGTQPAQPRR